MSSSHQGAVGLIGASVVSIAPPVSDALPAEQHRGLVLLSFPDDDRPVHGDGVEDLAHLVDGRLVGSVLVSLPLPLAGCESCGLRHPDDLVQQQQKKGGERGDYS